MKAIILISLFLSLLLANSFSLSSSNFFQTKYITKEYCDIKSGVYFETLTFLENKYTKKIICKNMSF